MGFRRWLAMVVVGLLGQTGLGQEADAEQGFAAAAVEQILKERVELGRNPGIVVGFVDSQGVTITAYGTAGRDGVALDGNTVFAVGSATKVFTALLLLEMEARGVVRRGDPVAELLPAGTAVPRRDGRQIGLIDLATQSSGLPRLPTNINPADPKNPFADYTVEMMYQFLATYQLPRAIGALQEDSILAMGLLGHALALRGGMSYEALLVERILRPLGMDDTRIEPSAAMAGRLAQGHDFRAKPTPDWDIPALAGAGALRSTAADMVRFLEANINGGPLGEILAEARVVQAPGLAGMVQAIGWIVSEKHADRPIVWHNGGTGGFRFFMGLDMSGGQGVVVLTNGASGVEDIGLHLLDRRHSLVPPPPLRLRTEVAVDRGAMLDHVGVYQLGADEVFAVTLEGERLFGQPTNQPKVALYAESERDFFFKEADVQLRFETDGNGKTTGLIIQQNGRDRVAKKLK